MTSSCSSDLGWLEAAHNSQTPPLRPRAAKRLRVGMAAGFRETHTRKVLVNVYDLSTDGFRIETYVGVHEGKLVWLTLPGIEPREAEVMWVKGDFAGCRFKQPLHDAVLQMVASSRKI